MCPLSSLPAVKDGFSSWCSLAWVYRIYLASGIESLWKREISKPPFFVVAHRKHFVFKLTTVVVCFCDLLWPCKDTTWWRCWCLLSWVERQSHPGQKFYFYFHFPCPAQLSSVSPTACLVPGCSTAVKESRASQLSKHSTLNDSPECVLLCQSLPSSPPRGRTLLSPCLCLQSTLTLRLGWKNNGGALDWGWGIDRYDAFLFPPCYRPSSRETTMPCGWCWSKRKGNTLVVHHKKY